MNTAKVGGGSTRKLVNGGKVLRARKSVTTPPHRGSALISKSKKRDTAFKNSEAERAKVRAKQARKRRKFIEMLYYNDDFNGCW